MTKDLAKQYNPKDVEDRIYDLWLEGNYFHGKLDENKEPFTIVIPPPNITGQLHMGHALDNTLQDILIRWRRMQGYDALWMPGTDHASIATEAKLVEALKKEGLDKEELGREEFLKRAWEWKEKYGGTIIKQLKKLGSSCDWERERFTLDEGCNKAVNEFFVRLYEKGFIYRGERIINWCPTCLTSISDAEVEYEEKESSLWHIRYPLEDGSGYLTVATTRPETMLGDTAVAVHPDDDRYKSYVGKSVILPVVNKAIPVVADDYVEQEFGTGVVKITPAHDPNDFEIGLRHDLPVLNVLTEDGHMNENAGRFVGMDMLECRKALVEELTKGEYLVKTEPLKHNVGACYRCRTTVEPRVSKQWFVRMKPLAEPAIKIVQDGTIRFVPERFEKIYFHWMENIKDWCISRQLWWGHRIPAWYCQECGEITVSKTEPEKCSHCGSNKLEQDPDTLDTWFSSALWPYSTLGWPEQTPELKHYYPTDTLVTGYDIIFFWVARMIFSAIENTGKEPFNTVFIHGIVRDALGRKMSKSLGNGIDPLEIIDLYGADALRFALASGNSPGNDMRFSEEKVESSRNFANKIWNAARFIMMNLDEDEEFPALPENLALEDKWLLSRFNTTVEEVTRNLEKFELGIAIQKLYDFAWDIFCDWYIELSKIRLQKGGDDKEQAKAVLLFVMDGILKLIHPFMPFITEEIWQKLPHCGEAIMVAPWPQASEDYSFPAEEEEMERIMQAIRAVRNRRAEMNVPPSKKAKLYVDTAYADTFNAGAEFLKKLAWASEVEVGESAGADLKNAVNIVTKDAKIFIPMGDLVDFEAERARLNKELESSEKQLASVNAQLANENFLAKAPPAVVSAQKEAAEKLKEKIAMLRESIANIGQ